MCDTCGCNDGQHNYKIRKMGEEHQHQYEHSHFHGHDHEDHQHSHTHVYSHTHDDGEITHEHEHHQHVHEDHDHPHEKELILQQNILHKNDLLAERNRGFFEAKKVFAVNLVSSPGSGKTTILERTISILDKEVEIAVIEGDQQTSNDAERIKKAGAEVVQINTGNGCHLDAEMINKAAKELHIADHSVLMIENVGNLVCPSLFDLGEDKRVVIISVTEGEDKPLKYPNMFQTSDLCIINKTDLLPYVDFNLEKVQEYALRVNHHLEFITMSAKTGEGMDTWCAWLKKNKKA